jgi:hypothetical protein
MVGSGLSSDDAIDDRFIDLGRPKNEHISLLEVDFRTSGISDEG